VAINLHKLRKEDDEEAEESQEVFDERDASSSVEYDNYLRDRKKYELLQRLVPQMETLAENLTAVEDEDDEVRPSGYRFDNKDAYDDGVRSERESNNLLNALARLEKDPEFLTGNENEESRKKPFSRFVKNGVHVAIEPPMREDKETKEMIRRSKKGDIDVKSIQDSLVNLLSKSIDTVGEEDMSFFDAVKNLHINRFKQTPVSRRNVGAYLGRIKQAKDTIMGSTPDPIKSKLQALNEIFQNYLSLKRNDARLMEKVSELSKIVDDDNVEEMVSRKINSINRTIRTLIDEGKFDQLKGKYKEISAIKENPESVVAEVKENIEKEIETYRESINKIADDINDILRYEDEFEDTLNLMKRFIRINAKEIDYKIEQQKKDIGRLEGRESTSDAQIKFAKESLEKLVKRKKSVDNIRKILMSNYNIIKDLEDEFKLMNKTLGKLQEAEEDDLSDLIDAITQYSLFRTPDSQASIRAKRNAINKVTSITMEEIDEAVEASTEAVENLAKLQANIEEAKEKLERITVRQ
tara:strand:+ start:443 stop:2014 length:1572 start_codon:yes stop_codon:yes gene_type:complete